MHAVLKTMINSSHNKSDFRATVSAARCLVVLPLLQLLLAVVCASRWQNKMMMMMMITVIVQFNCST